MGGGTGAPQSWQTGGAGAKPSGIDMSYGQAPGATDYQPVSQGSNPYTSDPQPQHGVHNGGTPFQWPQPPSYSAPPQGFDGNWGGQDASQFYSWISNLFGAHGAGMT